MRVKAKEPIFYVDRIIEPGEEFDLAPHHKPGSNVEVIPDPPPDPSAQYGYKPPKSKEGGA
jgi:hypothetical protein